MIFELKNGKFEYKGFTISLEDGKLVLPQEIVTKVNEHILSQKEKFNYELKSSLVDIGFDDEKNLHEEGIFFLSTREFTKINLHNGNTDYLYYAFHKDEWKILLHEIEHSECYSKTKQSFQNMDCMTNCAKYDPAYLEKVLQIYDQITEKEG